MTKGQETRESIIRQAAELFNIRGYAGASMSELMALTGLKKGGSLAWRASVTGGMAGSLFLRAFERSDRIYTAMLSRGYNGEVRSQPLPRLNGFDWLVLCLVLGLLLALLGMALLFWG